MPKATSSCTSASRTAAPTMAPRCPSRWREILGYTTLDHIRLIWGDSDSSAGVPGLAQRPDDATARRGALQRRGQAAQGPAQARVRNAEGGCRQAADPRRRDLLDGRSQEEGHVCGAGQSQQGPHPAWPAGALHPEAIGRAMNRGIGACFAEVEVDTWTGDWRYVQSGLLRMTPGTS